MTATATNPLTEETLADAKALALIIAPELQARPLYVVDTRRLDGLPCRDGCLGWAMAGPLMFHAIIERLGDDYVGPGPVIAIDGEAIAAEALPGQFDRCVSNVLVHEVAHIVPAAEIIEPRQTEFSRKFQFNRLIADSKSVEPEPDDPNSQHGKAFVRRCTHLAIRAAFAGRDVPWLYLYGPFLHLNHAQIYMTILLAEAFRMRDESFASIEATAPPSGFDEMWVNDLENYKRMFIRGYA